MTLVEMVVATAVASFVGVAILTMTVHVTRSTVAMTNYADLNAHSRNALDVMSRKIRCAEAVTAYSTNAITFRINGTGTLRYAWDSRTRTLTETDNGRSRVLLEGCNALAFTIYQRSPESNQFAFFDTANNIAEAKLVQVTWDCAREIMQAPATTEETVSAKIMMRIP